MGDDDGVCQHGRGDGDSVGVGVTECDVVDIFDVNDILRKERLARTQPARMRCTVPSAGRSSRPEAGRRETTTTSPWRGVGPRSKAIRRKTSTPGSRGTTGTTTSLSNTQSHAAASQVGKLFAMYHGLISKLTNGEVEHDQWETSRCSREQGTNENRGASKPRV